MIMTSMTLVSAEELLTPRFADANVELVAGIVRHMTPPGAAHGAIAAELLRALAAHVKEGQAGRLFVETGFVLARNPDTVRGPDVAFVSTERLAREGIPRGYFEGGPDLAVEVLSPGDSWSEVNSKIAEYLRAGTKAVWMVDPRTRTVTIHEAGGTIRRLAEAENLDGGAVLPGFVQPISSLFEGIAQA